MSSVYALEPPTKGKVILHTTSGDLEIELWAKETPRTCRNFIQLCLEGYYDNTLFNRIVKGYVVQGGDPTGTGLGGESIYGKPFPDEFHSRLRFSHRGILAMASTGPDTNTSQFFFTLDKAEELTMRNTIFGKIVGDTIFNLVKISESETDGDERPLYDVKIISVDILHNPFEDIVPRITPEERRIQLEMDRLESQRKADTRPKGKRDTKLLSFAGDEEEGDEVFVKSKIKSSHDIEKANSKFSSKAVVDATKLIKPASGDRMRQPEVKNVAPTRPTFAEAATVSSEDESEVEEITEPKINLIQSEIQKIKKQIVQIGVKTPAVEVAVKQKKNPIAKSLREEFSGKSKAIYGKRKKGNEDDVMAQLNSFKSKLFGIKQTIPIESEKKPVCKLHHVEGCESCQAIPVDEEDDDITDWMSNRLVFKKQSANVYEPKVDDYILIDPRLEAKGVEANPIQIDDPKRKRSRLRD